MKNDILMNVVFTQAQPRAVPAAPRDEQLVLGWGLRPAPGIPSEGHAPRSPSAGTQTFRWCEQQVLTDTGQAEVEVAPDRHADTEGLQGSVPQSFPAHHRHVWLVLSRSHLQLVVGPDGLPALTQQGLGTSKGQRVTGESGLVGCGVCVRMSLAVPGLGGLALEYCRSSRDQKKVIFCHPFQGEDDKSRD